MLCLRVEVALPISPTMRAMANTVNWIVLLIGLGGAFSRFRYRSRRRALNAHRTVPVAERRRELEDEVFALLSLIVLVLAANVIEDPDRLRDLGVPGSEVGRVLWWITMAMFATLAWAVAVAIRRRTHGWQTLIAPVVCALINIVAMVGLLGVHGGLIFHLPVV
jgi:hypothetical protein